MHAGVGPARTNRCNVASEQATEGGLQRPLDGTEPGLARVAAKGSSVVREIEPEVQPVQPCGPAGPYPPRRPGAPPAPEGPSSCWSCGPAEPVPRWSGGPAEPAPRSDSSVRVAWASE